MKQSNFQSKYKYILLNKKNCYLISYDELHDFIQIILTPEFVLETTITSGSR